MSKIIQVSSSWPGFSNLSYLMIFGDSYSSIGYDLEDIECESTAQHPLGVPFPGITWNEEGMPNWVGHLLTKYFPRPRFVAGKDATQDPRYLEAPLLVYDYAAAGDTIVGVQRQIRRFLSNVGQMPHWAPWAFDNTLFITWVGINDCSRSIDHKGNMLHLFKLQEELYEAGGRNFLFIDIPPINRSPSIPEYRAEFVATVYKDYNTELNAAACDFAARHPDITVLLYSSAATFNGFLDSPEEHGFLRSDCRKAGGAIWHDRAHPTSKVHDYVGRDLSQFLGTVERIELHQL